MEDRFGPWTLGRRVAVGNFADVTEASRDGGDVIALKRLHAHTARDPEMRALFVRECEIARTLPRHPGLVRGLETGDVDGRPWLAMDLVAGADLRRRIDSGTAPSAGRARSIVRELCAALEHLHRAGWVHGDVNPSNILVEPGPFQGDASASGFGPVHALLCDFGVARPPGEPGPVRGTHAYMAPEQVRGEPWSPATDVFALGVVLWELAAGTRLFLRGASYLSMAAVIEDVVPPLPDPALDAIVQRALAKDATARFASPGELAAALG
jgi:serine/threonine protein kinase